MADYTGEKPSVFSYRVQKAFRDNNLEGASLSYRLKCLQLEEKTVRRFLRHRTIQTWDAMKQIQDVKSSQRYLYEDEDKYVKSCHSNLNCRLNTEIKPSNSEARISWRQRRIEEEVNKKRSCLIRNCPMTSSGSHQSITQKRKHLLERGKETKNREASTSTSAQFGHNMSSALYSRYSLPPLPRSAPGFSRQSVQDYFSDNYSDSISVISRPSTSQSLHRDDK